MSTFNFNGPIGQAQAGDHNTMNVHQLAGPGNGSAAGWDAERTRAVLALAERLVEVVGREHPALRPHAEAVRAELVPTTAPEGTSVGTPAGTAAGAGPDIGRIRQRLELIAAGVGTGTAALALIEGIVHAMGG
ncbi:hypothetical protein [Actinacidiphila acididurans]|uniref:Uncharacterized protein n=1 Tax=Actinacidiphila acididurans TaxID=2784346 RepID=A0ABS2U7C8_9ACTN|nr:hypothetical protein [Actinacidiphila acididurans]MBM9510671.1 hypothetical protein [Actinacidiphila acididurans]